MPSEPRPAPDAAGLPGNIRPVSPRTGAGHRQGPDPDGRAGLAVAVEPREPHQAASPVNERAGPDAPDNAGHPRAHADQPATRVTAQGPGLPARDDLFGNRTRQASCALRERSSPRAASSLRPSVHVARHAVLSSVHG